MIVDPLKVRGEGGRSQGQKVGTKLQLGKNGGRKEGELSLKGQSHTHKGRVSRNLGLSEGVRKIRLRGPRKGLRR